VIVKLRKLLKTAGDQQIEPVNLLKQKMFGAKNEAISYNNQRHTSTAPSTQQQK